MITRIEFHGSADNPAELADCFRSVSRSSGWSDRDFAAATIAGAVADHNAQDLAHAALLETEGESRQRLIAFAKALLAEVDRCNPIPPPTPSRRS